MNTHPPPPPVTICVLTYGEFPDLARRSIGSILQHCVRDQYRLVVGANAVCAETERYLRALDAAGAIDRLIVSPENINKCPMMRRMFEGIDTEYIWWFDDDSHVLDESALPAYLKTASESPAKVVMWGQSMVVTGVPCAELGPEFAIRFVRTAEWYRGLTPPSIHPGGKGEMDFEGAGTGDPRWFFIVGGCWWIRTSAVRALDWPDPRLVKEGDDVLLGEAIRQQGWLIGQLGPNVAINGSVRRGSQGLASPGAAASGIDGDRE